MKTFALILALSSSVAGMGVIDMKEMCSGDAASYVGSRKKGVPYSQ